MLRYVMTFELQNQLGSGMIPEITAVYHLHGQTCRFTVWANGRQNSSLVNFVRESSLPFAQKLPFTEKRPRNPETGMKNGF